jgi:hypothetical protein
VAVGDFGFAEESVEGLHKLMILLGSGGCAFPGFARCCAAALVFGDSSGSRGEG